MRVSGDELERLGEVGQVRVQPLHSIVGSLSGLDIVAGEMKLRKQQQTRRRMSIKGAGCVEAAKRLGIAGDSQERFGERQEFLGRGRAGGAEGQLVCLARLVCLYVEGDERSAACLVSGLSAKDGFVLDDCVLDLACLRAEVGDLKPKIDRITMTDESGAEHEQSRFVLVVFSQPLGIPARLLEGGRRLRADRGRGEEGRVHDGCAQRRPTE